MPVRQRHFLHATAGRGDGGFGRLREGMGRDLDRTGQAALAQDFDQGLWPRQSGFHQDGGGHLFLAQGFERGQVDRGVFDPERVLEALELGDALHQGQLATLEARRHGAAGLLALGPTAGRLVALAAGAATDAVLGLGGARGGRQVVQLRHFATSSTLIRCGTRAIMPRISGRSGSSLVCPMPRRPRARSVPRCLGLVPMADLVWVTTSVGPVVLLRRSGHGLLGLRLRVQVGLALALAVGPQHAAGGDLVGRLAPQRGHVVGTAQLLEARRWWRAPR